MCSILFLPFVEIVGYCLYSNIFEYSNMKLNECPIFEYLKNLYSLATLVPIPVHLTINCPMMVRAHSLVSGLMDQNGCIGRDRDIGEKRPLRPFHPLSFSLFSISALSPGNLAGPSLVRAGREAPRPTFLVLQMAPQ